MPRSRSSRRSGCASRRPDLIACPSCGRTNVEVHELAGEVDSALAALRRSTSRSRSWAAPSTGPAKRGNADLGIAGGRDSGFIYAHGEVLRKVPQEQLVDELFREIDAWIDRGMPRPERGTPMRVIGVVGA